MCAENYNEVAVNIPYITMSISIHQISAARILMKGNYLKKKKINKSMVWTLRKPENHSINITCVKEICMVLFDRRTTGRASHVKLV